MDRKIPVWMLQAELDKQIVNWDWSVSIYPVRDQSKYCWQHWWTANMVQSQTQGKACTSQKTCKAEQTLNKNLELLNEKLQWSFYLEVSKPEACIKIYCIIAVYVGWQVITKPRHYLFFSSTNWSTCRPDISKIWQLDTFVFSVFFENVTKILILCFSSWKPFCSPPSHVR